LGQSASGVELVEHCEASGDLIEEIDRLLKLEYSLVPIARDDDLLAVLTAEIEEVEGTGWGVLLSVQRVAAE
jgi:hypothetical protein